MRSHHNRIARIPNCKYTPKQLAQRIDYLMNRIDKLKKTTEIKIDMGKCINVKFQKPKQKTTLICCFAGLVAEVLTPKEYYKASKDAADLWHYESECSADYVTGRYGLQNFLGFNDVYDPHMLLKKYPELWGSPTGHFITCSSQAYLERGQKTVTVVLIIKRWRNLAENLRRIR